MPSYRLWDGPAPRANGDDAADTPFVTMYRPAPGWGNGTAVVIAPGGGYASLSRNLEGAEPAYWFTARGVTAFVLTYRVGPAMLPVPLFDGARAIRFVRANALRFGIDPNRIGIMGFSAGGHLAAMTAVDADAGDAAAVDPVERVSSRPDFVALVYPWLEATIPDAEGLSPYCDFAQRYAKVVCRSSDYTAFVPALRVKMGAPPTFIYHTGDDKLVPADGSVRYYLALKRLGVPAELHVFEPGAHASGLGGSHPALSHWPALLQEWLRYHGYLPPPSEGKIYP